MPDVPTVQTSFILARDLNLVTIYAAFVAIIVFFWKWRSISEKARGFAANSVPITQRRSVLVAESQGLSY